MDRFFKKIPAAADAIKEENELLRLKIHSVELAAAQLETQLKQEKEKADVLQEKAAVWKEKVKVMVEADRAKIAQLSAELEVYKSVEAGSTLSPEVTGLIEHALGDLRAQHAQTLATANAETEQLRQELARSRADHAETQKELEKMKQIHLDAQQRFVDEMAALENHHEKERSEWKERLSKLSGADNSKVSRLERGEGGDAQPSKEQSDHQALMNALREELAKAMEESAKLVAVVSEKEAYIAETQQKTAIWKEKVKQMKLQDTEVIRELQERVEVLSRSVSRAPSVEVPPVQAAVADGQPDTSPSPLEELEFWKRKAEEDRAHDAQIIADLRSQLAQLQAAAPPPAPAPEDIRNGDSKCPTAELDELKTQLQEERESHRQFVAKLEQWKQRAKEIKDHDTRIITDLQTRCVTLEAELSTLHLQAKAAADRKKDTPSEHGRAEELNTSTAAETHDRITTAISHSNPTPASENQLHDAPDEMSNAHDAAALRQNEIDALQSQLAAAAEARAALQAELDQRGAEVEQLREQAASCSTDAQQQLSATRQEIDALQSQLAAAAEARAALQAELDQRGAEVAQTKGLLAERDASLSSLETSLVAWKEKVKAAKVADSERIAVLEGDVREGKAWMAQWVDQLHSVYIKVLGDRDGSIGDNPTELIARFNSELESLKATLSGIVASDAADEAAQLPALVASVQAKVTTLEVARDDAASDAESVREEKVALLKKTGQLEEELVGLREAVAAYEASEATEEALKELREANVQLEERCELLRKEVKRQRDAFQRERAQQERHAVSPAQEVSAGDHGAMESALRAAAGGVFERDMLSLAATQSQRDAELKVIRARVQTLEKENEELRRAGEYNNRMVAEYTKELEVYKGKERVQMSIEYVRNIVLQFLCAADDIRPKMIPAIATVLGFGSKEKQDVMLANPKCPKFH